MTTESEKQGRSDSLGAAPGRPAIMSLQPLYPNRYVWFVFLSAMDVFMTFIVLQIGGSEANGIANWILERYGLSGMTLETTTPRPS